MKWNNSRSYLFISLVFLFFILTTTGAIGDEQVTMKVKPGFNGLYKQSSLVPIQVVVENKGPDLAGKLVVIPVDGYSQWARVDLAGELFVPAGETKKMEFFLPGAVAANSSKINLLVGDKVLTGAPLQGLTVRDEGILVLGISERGDIYQPLMRAQDKGGSFDRILTGKTMAPQDVPTSFFTLQGADIIVLDGQSDSKLTAAQKEAIAQWVAAGGVLIVSQGHDKSGQLLAAPQGVPLIYRHLVGQGAIITSTYDLLTESGLTSEEELKLWRAIINSKIFGAGAKSPGGFWGNYYSYLEASNWFDSIAAPNLMIYGGILGGYLLLIGPLLYLVLRRADKRDLSWLIIPLTALLLAIGITGVGKARIKGDGIRQTASVINIIGEEGALVEGAGAVIIPQGGQYGLQIPAHTYALPVTRGRTTGEMIVNLNEREGQQVSFAGVEYWSVRNIIFNSWLTDLGSIQGELALKNDTLTGTLINNTNLELKGAVLTVGPMSFDLGDWPQGEEIKLEQILSWEQARDINQAPDYRKEGVGEKLTPPQERLIQASWQDGRPTMPVTADYEKFGVIGDNQALMGQGLKENFNITISGWSNEEFNFFTMNNFNVKNNSNHLITQKIAVDLGGADKLFYPWGAIQPIYQGGLEYAHLAPNVRGIVLQGILQLDFALGEKILVERLTNNFYAKQLPEVEAALYNWQTQGWDSFKEKELQVMTADVAAPYLSEQGVLRVRFINKNGTREFIPEPAIQVLGRVSP